jgi:hypothetical protein
MIKGAGKKDKLDPAKADTAASHAKRTWQQSPAAIKDHPYLAKKNVEPYGIRQHGDKLIIPMYLNGRVVNLQWIDAEGEKTFEKGGRTKDCYFQIDKHKTDPGKRVLIGTGFATCATARHATLHETWVAFSDANLPAIAKMVRQRNANAEIVIVADDDWKLAPNGKPFNSGLVYGKQAALECEGLLAIPNFGMTVGREDKDTDFNDLARLANIEVVKKQIAEAKAPALERPTDEEDEEVVGTAAKDDSPKKQADILIDIAREEATVFRTPDRVAYVDLEVDGHRETWPVRSDGFKHWLRHRYYEEQESAPAKDALQQAIEQVESDALFKKDSRQRQVFMRVASTKDCVYLDLCDDEWQAVKITPKGWKVVTRPKVRFVRHANMLPIPEPETGGSIELLRPFLNVSDADEFTLIVGWQLGTLRPWVKDQNYAVLNITGEEGVAKSTAAKLLRNLIDPNRAPLRGMPQNELDMLVAAENSFVQVYDNASHISGPLSDAICRISTGSGAAKRKLYTDNSEYLFEGARPVIMTSVKDVVTRGDLASRTYFISPDPIPAGQRKTEKTFWAEVEKVRPKILGALFDMVSRGLRMLPTTVLADPPRMADAATWVTACEGKDWESGRFEAAVKQNRMIRAAVLVEGDLVAIAIQSFMDDKAEWSGTATDLLDCLNLLTEDEKRKQKSWPKAPNSLTNKFRPVASSLREVGINITKGKDTSADRTRVITIINSRRDRPDRPKACDINDLASDDPSDDPENGSSADKVLKTKDFGRSGRSGRSFPQHKRTGFAAYQPRPREIKVRALDAIRSKRRKTKGG